MGRAQCLHQLGIVFRFEKGHRLTEGASGIDLVDRCSTLGRESNSWAGPRNRLYRVGQVAWLDAMRR